MNANANMDRLLDQANFVLDACGRPIPPANTSWVDIPAHIGYSRLMPGDGTILGSEDIGGIMHKGRVSFMLRAVTAQALPRDTQGVYWRLRFGDGRYLQSELTSHSMAFGFGSDRQVFVGGTRDNPGGVEWKVGEKLFVDLDTIIAGPPPVGGYTVVFQFEGVYRFPISGAGAVSNPITQDMPRYFSNENQNILAPPASFGPTCPSETPQGFQDETYWYQTSTSDLQITGRPVSNVQLQIQPQSDFICREVWPYFPGVSPTGATQGFGSVVVRMHRGDGYNLSSNFLPVNSIQGPMFKELKIKARDTFSWDAYVVDGGGAAFSVVTFGLYLGGVRRRAVS